MGAPMTERLRAARLDVAGWRRGEDLAAAVAGRDAVLTMLPDADAVTEVAAAALPNAPDGVVWIQSSTVGLEGIERCDALAAQHGATLVDAPVLGTKQPAQEGKLVVLAGGDDATLDRCCPVFDAIGQRTVRAGGVGDATRLKLVTNGWLVAIVEGAAEALALADGLGVDPRLFLHALEGGGLGVPYLRVKAPMILEPEFPPSFSLRLAAKDARLVAVAAARRGL